MASKISYRFFPEGMEPSRLKRLFEACDESSRAAIRDLVRDGSETRWRDASAPFSVQTDLALGGVEQYECSTRDDFFRALERGARPQTIHLRWELPWLNDGTDPLRPPPTLSASIVHYAMGDEFTVDLSSNYGDVEAAVRDAVTRWREHEQRISREGQPPVVFVGHGRDACWRELKDDLKDKVGVDVRYYEDSEAAGRMILDQVETLLAGCEAAVLVFSADDEFDGELRPRMNVLHELGLAQGLFGRSRAILVVERGIENASNLDGLNYVAYDKGQIRSAFSAVRDVLRREFPDRRVL